MARRPAQITLSIYQGQTFDDEIVFEDGSGVPLDFTGSTARMQIRRALPDDEVILELTTANAMIQPLSNDGLIKFNVDAVDTASLPTDNVDQVWVYDLELEDGAGGVVRLMQGSAVVYPEVTR
jgi:hypothetical protein